MNKDNQAVDLMAMAERMKKNQDKKIKEAKENIMSYTRQLTFDDEPLLSDEVLKREGVIPPNEQEKPPIISKNKDEVTVKEVTNKFREALNSSNVPPVHHTEPLPTIDESLNDVLDEPIELEPINLELKDTIPEEKLTHVSFSVDSNPVSDDTDKYASFEQYETLDATQSYSQLREQMIAEMEKMEEPQDEQVNDNQDTRSSNNNQDKSKLWVTYIIAITVIIVAFLIIYYVILGGNNKEVALSSIKNITTNIKGVTIFDGIIKFR